MPYPIQMNYNYRSLASPDPEKREAEAQALLAEHERLRRLNEPLTPEAEALYKAVLRQPVSVRAVFRTLLAIIAGALAWGVFSIFPALIIAPWIDRTHSLTLAGLIAAGVAACYAILSLIRWIVVLLSSR
jgi:hypothetical protein